MIFQAGMDCAARKARYTIADGYSRQRRRYSGRRVSSPKALTISFASASAAECGMKRIGLPSVIVAGGRYLPLRRDVPTNDIIQVEEEDFDRAADDGRELEGVLQPRQLVPLLPRREVRDVAQPGEPCDLADPEVVPAAVEAELIRDGSAAWVFHMCVSLARQL